MRTCLTGDVSLQDNNFTGDLEFLCSVVEPIASWGESVGAEIRMEVGISADCLGNEANVMCPSTCCVCF